MPNPNMTKTQWVELFRETGLDEATMRQWHRLFEQRHPAQHQAFLESLGIDAAEITLIRQHSRR